MKIKEYMSYDGLGLGNLVKTGQVSASELLETAIQRCEQVNPKLNAVTISLYEQARSYIKTHTHCNQSSPFTGVPFLLKDLFQEYKGAPLSNGSRSLKNKNYAPDFTAEIVSRWQTAGVTVFGRTNSPELGLKGITEPAAWGSCHNPWHLKHNSGGSSGGAGSVVAAGIVPMAAASDGGGSIRIPASYCGVFGLKPSRGRTPWGPGSSEAMHGAAMQHILSRSVRDSAAMLDATQGYDLSSLFDIQSIPGTYLDCIKQPPKRLKIAFTTQSPIGTKVSKDAIAAVQHTAKLLTRLGHDVVEDQPGIDGMALASDFIVMWFSQCALAVDDIKRMTQGSDNDFELDTRAAAAFGAKTRATEYLRCLEHWGHYTRQLNTFFQRYDLYLTPATASVAPKNGEVVTPKWQQLLLKGVLKTGQAHQLVRGSFLVEQIVQSNLRWVPFTQLANITGVPAMSVPLYWSKQGLPLGSQFVAPFGHEHVLLALAAQLEQAQPWQPRYDLIKL
ncbi:amidase [Alkanindiges sp. WGS2144]|uniref:amidase n=1 Tax=Alkanindiges sp. WGS2144 TaxID=3366808 RepID=UPI0037515472